MKTSKTSNRNVLFSLLFTAFLFTFSGCFEAQFDFKTIVGADGTVIRESHIDGRGANLFKLPKGEGWQAKAWETKGTSTLLPAEVHHIEANGEFKPGQLISSDYEFNFSKQMESWQDSDRKKVEKAGIKQPFEQHLFSRNNIRVNQLNGFFTVTTIYEETFQNLGVMELLMLDLKEELAKQAAQSGQDLKDPELGELARLRLESEILPEIHFKNELRMPGKLVSTNGKPTGDGTIQWQFSLKDFQKGYSIYTLQAVSRTLKAPGLGVLVFLGSLLLIFVILAGVGMKQISSKQKSRNKKP